MRKWIIVSVMILFVTGCKTTTSFSLMYTTPSKYGNGTMALTITDR